MTARRVAVALGCLVAGAAMLACGHVSARLAFSNGVNVLTAATARSVFTALLLLALIRLRRTPILPLTRQARLALLLGILVAAQTALVQLAVSLLPVTLALLVFYTFPFFTGIVTSLLGTDRLTPTTFVALAAALLGLALVLGVAPQGVNPLGVAAALAASVCFTAMLVLTPRLAPTLDGPLRTFMTMGLAALIFVTTAAVTQDVHWPRDAAARIGLAGLMVFYAVGIILVFLALPMLGPAQSAVVLNTEPVFAALIAWAALGEVLTPLQVAGAMIVVGAVTWYQVAKVRVRQ
jgi:drug/metabolite transporter (DMT)-like permease